MMTRDYLSVKVWDLNMENRPVETYQVRNCTQDMVFMVKNTAIEGWAKGFKGDLKLILVLLE